MAPDHSYEVKIENRLRSVRDTSRDMGPECWIDVGGIRTRYFEKGEGVPAVFFHGGNIGSSVDACSARCWDLNLPALSRSTNCVAVDRLGQGYTDNPKSDDGYTMHASVQHAAEFLRVLGKGPYHLVGHSRGGYLVCRIALEYPELVRTCTIISSGTLTPGLNNNSLHLADPPLPLLSRESQRWICERYSYNPKVVTEDWLDEGVAIASTAKNMEAVRKMAEEGLEAGLYMPELRRQCTETQRLIQTTGLACPTLIVWGYNDRTALFETGKLLIEMLMEKQPRTEMRLFNRAGHFVYREHFEAFNGMLADYIAQNTQ